MRSNRTDNNGKAIKRLSAVILGILLCALAFNDAISERTTTGTNPSAGAQKLISFDFSNTDILAFIKIVSELTGKNFVVDERVKGKVNVISPEKIPLSAVYSIFQSVLSVHGYTAVPMGDIVKIIPQKQVKDTGVETYTGRLPDKLALEEYVTLIRRLRYIDAQELIAIFRTIMPPEASIIAHAPSNTLIITDTRANVSRMMMIIDNIDIMDAFNEPRIFELKYADAQTIADILYSLFSGDDSVTGNIKTNIPGRRGRRATVAGGAQQLVIVPETRTNSLIISADANQLRIIESLIQSLDSEVSKDRSSFHVYYLEHADAQNLKEVLTQQVTQVSHRPGMPPQQSSGQSLFKEEVVISADQETNSLIITASPYDYQILKDVIAKLDVPRAQVLVEALIVELTLEKSQEIGVEWRSLEQPEAGKYTPFGGTTLPSGASGSSALTEAMTNPYAPPSGMILGIAKGTFTFGGKEYVNIGALARAFQADSDVNVLSTPHILTLDNQEAEIIIGEERPFLRSTQTTSLDSVIRTYEYKDVGLTLRITPHISQSQFVKLDIFQEIKDFVEQMEVGAITTTKRQAKTTVVVEDKQTVVIGGLIKDNISKGNALVPCLGKIPIIGWLFKSMKTQNKKTNLMIFITPYIISNPAQLVPITDSKHQKMEDLLKEHSSDIHLEDLPGKPTPTPDVESDAQ